MSEGDRSWFQVLVPGPGLWMLCCGLGGFFGSFESFLGRRGGSSRRKRGRGVSRRGYHRGANDDRSCGGRRRKAKLEAGSWELGAGSWEL